MNKKYNEFFRKLGNQANVIPELLAELQANGSRESRRFYYAKKLDEANGQGQMISQEDLNKAIERMPDDKVVVFFNLQFIYTLKENDFLALDAYIEIVRQRRRIGEFYRGFRHGPAVTCAFTKKQSSEKVRGMDNFSGYPTVALYL